jgi:HAD superfamily hydrolase (TIGR01490 family)
VSEPTALVFTDLDETLIDRKSLLDFLDFYFADRFAVDHVAGVVGELAVLAAGGASRAQANRAYYRVWQGQLEAEVAERGRHWFAERAATPGFFNRELLRALRRHRAAGAAVVLVSGSFPAVAGPVAEAIGAAHLLCTRPESRDGVLTGAVVGEPVIGEGKRDAMRSLFRRYPQVVPAACFAYGDHASDLPMLSEVGHPVIVGDDPVLARWLPDADRMLWKRPGAAGCAQSGQRACAAGQLPQGNLV